MSLLSREVELFDFSRGATHFRYTDIDRPVVAEGLTYLPARGLRRGRIEQSVEDNRNTLEIEAPLSLSVLDLFRPLPPMSRVLLRLIRVRVSDGLVRQSWSGVLADIEERDDKAIIRCQTLFADLGAPGLQRNWQVPCPLALYGQGPGMCNANKEAFKVPFTGALVVGNTLVAAAFAAHPDGWFEGGFIQWSDGDDVDVRFVVGHAGDTLTLLTPVLPGQVTAGDAFPGCDHAISTCDAKFGNADNYGGQHTIPAKNPFGSDPVF